MLDMYKEPMAGKTCKCFFVTSFIASHTVFVRMDLAAKLPKLDEPVSSKRYKLAV